MKAFADALSTYPEFAAVHNPYAEETGSPTLVFEPLVNIDELSYRSDGTSYAASRLTANQLWVQLKNVNDDPFLTVSLNQVLSNASIWALYQATMMAIPTYSYQELPSATPWTQPIDGAKLFKRGTDTMTEPLQNPKTALKS